jgi:hypothetical protein
MSMIHERMVLPVFIPLLLPPSVAISAQKADDPPAITIVRPERSWEQVEAACAEIPPVTYQPPADRWERLPITRKRLAGQGGPLRILMLGDSIINDTWRSRWVDRVSRHCPKSEIRLTNVVRGSTGCWWYKDNGRVARYVLPHKPELLIIGGISQRDDIDAIREVIRQVRAAGLCDVLLMTGSFGGIDPRDDTKWQFDITDPRSYRGRLRGLADEQKCAFLDMFAHWGRYVRESGRDIKWFMRDPVHANVRGEQILGQILACFLSPSDPTKP